MSSRFVLVAVMLQVSFFSARIAPPKKTGGNVGKYGATDSDDTAEQLDELAEAKQSVPHDAGQKEATSLIRDVYKADFEKAKTPLQKLELAKKLFREGVQTKRPTLPDNLSCCNLPGTWPFKAGGYRRSWNPLTRSTEASESIRWE